MNPIYLELSALCLPFIQHYQDDLLKHDYAELNASPDVPFLHWTRPTGTHLLLLHPADSPRWPAPDVTVPYLFGHATRDHILEQCLSIATYPHEHEITRVCHHFNGRDLTEITTAHGVAITQHYVARIKQTWYPRREEIYLPWWKEVDHSRLPSCYLRPPPNSNSNPPEP